MAALVRWADTSGRSITARGSGTGRPAGNVGEDVVVDLAATFDRIVHVDPRARTAMVEPGVSAARLDEVARGFGLRFPILPSSARWCTVGGMVANNSGAALSFAHGQMAAWTRSLRWVDPQGGTWASTRGDAEASDPLTAAGRAAGAPRHWPDVRKNASGYGLDRFATSGSPVDLLVGSEGTLGLVTRVELDLQVIPEQRLVAAVGLESLDDLLGWRSWAEAHGWVAFEFFGPWLVQHTHLSEDPELAPLVRGRSLVAVLEWEGDAEHAAAADRAIGARCEAEGVPFVTAPEGAAARHLWTLRHRASPAIQRFAAEGLASLQFIEDCVVPPTQLGPYLSGLDRILRGAGLEAAVFGHAGDANVHVNPLVPLRDPDWVPRVRAVLEEVVELVASLGGTLSGEHGDGRLRAPFQERIWGQETVDRFKTLKRTLDPNGTLNPGVILASPGTDPLAGLAATVSARPAPNSTSLSV